MYRYSTALVSMRMRPVVAGLIAFGSWLLSTGQVLAATANNAANSAAAKRATAKETEGAAFDVNVLFSAPVQEFFYRGLRVVAIVLVIYFVNSMFFGAFTQMNSSGKDDVVRDGRRHIVVGLLGAFAMLMVFFAASGALARVSA